MSAPANLTEANRLVEAIRGYGPCAVAFSAGVDSAVVVKAAHLALGDHAVAVTGVGPALAEGELDQAHELARQIGVRHEVVPTDEINQAPYVANAPDRCFHCKTELYTHVERVARRLGLTTIVNGANADDQGDYRPGMRAAADFKVRSPLLECGFGKAQVRGLARDWSLPAWDKPAAPCLASRLAYGVAVTPERLRRVDQAERLMKSAGFAEVRVRCLNGEAARVEVPRGQLARLREPGLFESLKQQLIDLGFASVSVDPDGLRSGSLNDVLPIETLDQWRHERPRTPGALP